jgi:hypothetical protein
MIIRETPNSFFYVTQHDHAFLSGRMVDHWRAAYFEDAARRADVALAIYQHDRAWIPLDATPLWNDVTHAPFSFLDFPAPSKLVHYQHGLDEAEQLNPYAGLLCSMHYASFFATDASDIGQAFHSRETQRQQRLRQQLGLTTEAQTQVLDFHLYLLKFCDNLSLYLCLNEPGVDKAHENPWYRKGIPYSDQFAFMNQQLIQASWADEHTVRVEPFPFEQPFSVVLRYKELPKQQINATGLTACFHSTPVSELEIRLTE